MKVESVVVSGKKTEQYAVVAGMAATTLFFRNGEYYLAVFSEPGIVSTLERLIDDEEGSFFGERETNLRVLSPGPEVEIEQNDVEEIQSTYELSVISKLTCMYAFRVIQVLQKKGDLSYRIVNGVSNIQLKSGEHKECVSMRISEDGHIDLSEFKDFPMSHIIMVGLQSALEQIEAMMEKENEDHNEEG